MTAGRRESDSRPRPWATRSIGKIAIDPVDSQVIYIATARSVRGISSTSGGSVSRRVASSRTWDSTRPPTVAPPGRFHWDAQTAGSVRGVTDVEIDPLDHTTVPPFQLGIFRSLAGGAFQRVFAGQAPDVNVDRTEFALTVKEGKTHLR